MIIPEPKSIPCGGNGVKSQMRWRFESLQRFPKRGHPPELRCRGSKKRWGESGVDILSYFCNYRTMRKPDTLLVTRCADRFSALGAEPRLQILRLLLAAHPAGMVSGEVRSEEHTSELQSHSDI